jgi:methionine-rich copper-binding protein CopC
MRALLPLVVAGLFFAAPAVAQDAHAGHGAHAGHSQAASGDHSAHGVVTSPADGAMTDGPPDWFTATFPHPMTLKAVTVQAEGGASVSVPVAAAAATTRVAAELPTLRPGNYALNWSADGADGHAMTGTVRFMVH